MIGCIKVLFSRLSPVIIIENIDKIPFHLHFFSYLNRGGNYGAITTSCNTKTLWILFTDHFHMFHMIRRLNGDYFSKQH
jgi:hypothetical protein